MIIEVLIYAVSGMVTGLMAGLLGIGGGLILVPVLSSVFLIFLQTEYIVHIAIATSLATILVTGLSSVISHHYERAVQWNVLRAMLLGILVGGFVGAWSSQFFSMYWLSRLFGVMEIMAGLYMIWGKQPHADRCLPGFLPLNGVGFGIGSLSALLGIGGGSISTPYLQWNNVVIQRAIATSAAIGLPIALAGTFGYMLAGLQVDNLPAYTTGFVYWPAFIAIVSMSVFTAFLGAKLAHRLPIKALKRMFGLLLIGLGIKMLFFS